MDNAKKEGSGIVDRVTNETMGKGIKAAAKVAIGATIALAATAINPFLGIACVAAGAGCYMQKQHSQQKQTSPQEQAREVGQGLSEAGITVKVENNNLGPQSPPKTSKTPDNPSVQGVEGKGR